MKRSLVVKGSILITFFMVIMSFTNATAKTIESKQELSEIIQNFSSKMTNNEWEPGYILSLFLVFCVYFVYFLLYFWA